ncbi:MAG: bidirectional hydrogenase complex protein HoxE [Acidobacteriia bacterium]|nr:bidirectional hydrogenase complex protein HoxE [Terriglobia bacterium]
MSVHVAPPPLPSDDQRWQIVNGTMRRHGHARDALIETLHTVQELFGYLDEESLKFVANSLRVPLSQAYGVATFYHFFSLQPPAKHTCHVCMGTACYIKGAAQLLARAKKILGMKPGEATPDGSASLRAERCMGSCSLAPVAIFDGEVTREATANEVQERLERWLAHDA